MRWLAGKLCFSNHRTLSPKAIYFRLSTFLFYYLSVQYFVNLTKYRNENKMNWTELFCWRCVYNDFIRHPFDVVLPASTEATSTKHLFWEWFIIQ